MAEEEVIEAKDVLSGVLGPDAADDEDEDVSRDPCPDPEPVEGEDEIDQTNCGQLVEVDVEEMTPEEVKAHEEEMRKIAVEQGVFEIKMKHPKNFTPEEDKLIAFSLRAGAPIYQIMDTVHCSRQFLMKHIEKTPALYELLKERDYRQKDEIEEGLADCVRSRDSKVLMWMAEKLLKEKYGDQQNIDDEDDTRLVIGAIPEEELAAADKIVEEASKKPPEAGLAAIIGAADEQGQAVGGGVGGAGVPARAPHQAAAPHAAAPHAAAPRPEDPSKYVHAADTRRLEEQPPADDGGGFDGSGETEDFGNGSWMD